MRALIGVSPRSYWNTKDRHLSETHGDKRSEKILGEMMYSQVLKAMPAQVVLTWGRGLPPGDIW